MQIIKKILILFFMCAHIQLQFTYVFVYKIDLVNIKIQNRNRVEISKDSEDKKIDKRIKLI